MPREAKANDCEQMVFQGSPPHEKKHEPDFLGGLFRTHFLYPSAQRSAWRQKSRIRVLLKHGRMNLFRVNRQNRDGLSVLPLFLIPT